jgi:hypothetical protein
VAFGGSHVMATVEFGDYFCVTYMPSSTMFRYSFYVPSLPLPEKGLYVELDMFYHHL